jgi:dienelactone hydrolase
MRYALLGAALAATALLLLLAWLFTLGPYRSVRLDRPVLSSNAPSALARGHGEPVLTAEAWRQRRVEILGALQSEVYGPMPADAPAMVVQRRMISAVDAGGIEGVEQIEIEVAGRARFNLVLVLPRRETPAPVIVMQNFCGNQAAFPGRPAAIDAPLLYYPFPCRYGVFDPFHRAVFGEWMLGPPFRSLAERGYAVAMFYGGDVVPDHPPDAQPALSSLDAEGAIAAWAWVHARVIDVLEADQRLDQDRIIAWGQSRFGKVALLAGATDPRIDAVLAFQSGRGGDALTSHRSGESVSAITRGYPHWFSRRFSAYATSPPPVDQHDLLALIAPRPLLLAHTRRDSWADPGGAYRAAAGARPVFDLLGASAPRFVVRDGVHGITDEDWRVTFAFLDEHLLR